MAMLFGRRPILEALESGTPLKRIMVAREAHGQLINRILNKAMEKGVPISRIPKDKIEDLFPGQVHQGIVADGFSRSCQDLSIEEFFKHLDGLDHPPFCVILDGVEDPHNLGALIRSANGAGADAVIIPKHRAAPITPTVAKSSAGAIESIQIIRVTNLVNTCQLLKNKNFWIVGADATAKDHWYQIDLTCPVAIVLGGEGRGIRRLLLEECDFVVKIPMFGRVSSLNVSVAGGILMYEVLRQRCQKGVYRNR